MMKSYVIRSLVSETGSDFFFTGVGYDGKVKWTSEPALPFPTRESADEYLRIATQERMCELVEIYIGYVGVRKPDGSTGILKV